MRVAITGGIGFLGRYVIDILKDENITPIILSRGNREIVETLNEVRTTDYSKEDLLTKLADIDAVVHLAARRGGQNQIFEFHDNEVLTQNLYDVCLQLNIYNIVYSSTISVYSGENTLPWTEKVLPAPQLMYGISKLTNEYLGNIYSKMGLRVKNLRFAHLFGFNEKNNYMINRFFRQAFHREQLVIHTKSIAKREFLYAKDAAKAILFALKHKDLSGTFNIGSGEAFTNFEVAKIITNVFNNPHDVLVENPNASETISSSYMDSSKAYEELKFRPDYSFTEAVSEIYDLMRGLDDVPLWY